MDYWLGNVGHLAIIISFISSLVGAFSYYKSIKDPLGWQQFSRSFVYIHVIAVFAIVAALFGIIYSGDYRYYYAWSHSADGLPFYYKISSFWEGQEGSFLLWAFWNAVLSLVLLCFSKQWEGYVMVIFFVVQGFLTSMILGVVPIDNELLNWKIGSSPFLLLTEAFPDSEVLAQDPNFVPEDGSGLNPLLQNYWMVIHPPTLFLGFATTLVPYAFCIAGLWKKDYTGWIKPALPWTIFSSAVLGTGIIMGGYWAYETLNFGGYWNWDPVENAVYIPWIIQIAGLHTMVLFKNGQKGIATSIIFICLTFILILYSTFLTRSGVLDNASVHSFTDLGLSGQLLLYLLAFLGLSIFLIAIRWKKLPIKDYELKMYNKELWVFLGIIVISLGAFHILLGTSLPLLKYVGLHKAPLKGEQYGAVQPWFAILMAYLAGFSQLLWWNNQEKVFSKKGLNFINAVIFFLLLGSIAIIYGMENYTDGFLKVRMLLQQNPNGDVQLTFYTRIFKNVLLAGASLFTLVTAVMVMMRLWKRNKGFTGGSIAHMGFALMLLGMLFSAGYSRVVSINKSGKLFSTEVSREFNVENILLWADNPTSMGKSSLQYGGIHFSTEDFPGYIHANDLIGLDDVNFPNQAIVTKDISWNGKLYYKSSDTVQIVPENTYYKVEYQTKSDQQFTLYPRVQENPEMGILPSPDIHRTLFSDLYTHVTQIASKRELRWDGEPDTLRVRLKEPFFINETACIVDTVMQIQKVPGVNIPRDLVIYHAPIIQQKPSKNDTLNPVVIFAKGAKGPLFRSDYDINSGVSVELYEYFPQASQVTLITQTKTPDYIIMKASEKPFINLLWLGTLILIAGFSIAARRRYVEYKLSNA